MNIEYNHHSPRANQINTQMNRTTKSHIDSWPAQ